MTQPANIPAIEKATHKSWKEWVSFIDENDGRNLSHREIAHLVNDILEETMYSSGWWAQAITVGYEQHIGRRVPGQNSQGVFEVSVSKTFHQDADNTVAAWLRYVTAAGEFDGIPLTGTPTKSEPAARRHWAVDLDDGSRLNADVTVGAADSSVLTITHTKLEDQLAIERWRRFWKQQLEVVSENT
jgi:hypothetical protein